MSSPQTSYQTTPSSGNEAHYGAEKTRLTDQEKKANHIRSERKRRDNVRAGMIKLSHMIPGAHELFKSEIKMVDAYTKYVEQLLVERQAMVQRLEDKGSFVEEHLKNPYSQNLHTENH